MTLTREQLAARLAPELEDSQEVLAKTGAPLTVPDDVPTMRLRATV